MSVKKYKCSKCNEKCFKYELDIKCNTEFMNQNHCRVNNICKKCMSDHHLKYHYIKCDDCERNCILDYKNCRFCFFTNTFCENCLKMHEKIHEKKCHECNIITPLYNNNLFCLACDNCIYCDNKYCSVNIDKICHRCEKIINKSSNYKNKKDIRFDMVDIIENEKENMKDVCYKNILESLAKL